MGKIFATMLSLLVLIGCASPVYLVNHQTGQTFQCSASTAWWGVGGGIATGIGANIQVQRCAEQMEALGYTRADNVAEKTKRI